MATKKSVKDKAKAVKAKAKKIKARVKGSCALALLALVCGCMDTNPASRQTLAQYGDIVVNLEHARSNTVTLTIGDGAIASADASGSTETQTATPAMDIRPDVDLNYNDAQKAATVASGALETLLGGGASALVKWMTASGTNTVTIVGADGTTKKAVCVDGKCTECADGSCSK